MVKDIQDKLSLENAEIIKHSFQRRNLQFFTYKKEDKQYALIRFLKKNKGSGIIYVRSRKATTDLKRILHQHQIEAEAYHGGLTSEEKKNLLQNWLNNSYPIMVATTAFGMGIDKADVRTIVHYQIPESLESYFQEAGRAGRDQTSAKALLLYNDADIIRLENQFLKILPTPKNVKYVYKKLNSYFAIAYGEGHEERFNFNFLAFCNTYNLPTATTYQVLQLLDRAGILNLTQEYHKQTEVQFLVSDKHLHYFLDQNPHYALPVRTLLRMYGGFFDHKIQVNLISLSKKTQLSTDKIIHLLKELHQKEVILLELRDQDTSIQFLVPREDQITVNPLIPYIKQQFKNKQEKIKAVLEYLENNEVCKNQQLLAYFGETITEKCGKCSVCLAEKTKQKFSRKELNNIYLEIKAILAKKEATTKTLTEQLNYPEEIIVHVLRKMLEQEKIKVSPNNIYSLLA